MASWFSVDNLDFNLFKIELNRRLRLVVDLLTKDVSNLLGGKTRRTTLTGTTTLTAAQFGLIVCDSATPITLNLPTAVGNADLGYVVSNIGAGAVTIDPYSTQLLQGDSTFVLYQDELLGFTSTNVGWVVST